MADLAGQIRCVHFQWNLRMIWTDLPRSLVWFGRKSCWTIFLNLKKQLPSGIQISHLVCQICILLPSILGNKHPFTNYFRVPNFQSFLWHHIRARSIIKCFEAACSNKSFREGLQVRWKRWLGEQPWLLRWLKTRTVFGQIDVVFFGWLGAQRESWWLFFKFPIFHGENWLGILVSGAKD